MLLSLWFVSPAYRFFEFCCMTPPFKSLPFIPHPWFRGGHAQTLAGAYLWRRVPHCAAPYVIDLPDGALLVAHDDVPHQFAVLEKAGPKDTLPPRLATPGVRFEGQFFMQIW